VVCCLGRNLAYSHHFVSGNAYWVSETIYVPELEQGYVQADVGRVEASVLDDAVEETAKVFDVVHSFYFVRFNCKKGRVIWVAAIIFVLD
jgi:hypothetical protein